MTLTTMFAGLGMLLTLEVLVVAIGYHFFYPSVMHIKNVVFPLFVLLLAGMIVLIAMSMAGCADTNYALQRALISADCRPEKLQPNGQCAPLK